MYNNTIWAIQRFFWRKRIFTCNNCKKEFMTYKKNMDLCFNCSMIEQKKRLSMGFGISRSDKLWTDLPFTIIDIEKIKEEENDDKRQTEQQNS